MTCTVKNQIAQFKGVISNPYNPQARKIVKCTKQHIEYVKFMSKTATINIYNTVNLMLNPILTRILTPVCGTYAGNMAGFIVATVTAVLIGMIILMYMINTAKDIAGNDSEMLTQINRVSGIANIALFFAVLAGFVIAAKFIIDIVNSSGGRGQGGM
jgi:small-conductance mechanosensitive channel